MNADANEHTDMSRSKIIKPVSSVLTNGTAVGCLKTCGRRRATQRKDKVNSGTWPLRTPLVWKHELDLLALSWRLRAASPFPRANDDLRTCRVASCENSSARSV